VTESDWLASTDPQAMLDFLRDKVSDRKLRLFAVACCRSISDLLSPDPGMLAVETAERWADGQASEQDVRDARRRSSGFADPGVFPKYADAFGVTVLSDRAWDAAAQAARWASRYREEAGDAERATQSRLLRCVFGNPLRPVVLRPSWLAWSHGTVPELARAIYDTRAFDRMPLLADALTDAGCTEPDVLGHPRLTQEHIRGCWVVDLVLQKE
jgi:hypothetical protein